jgi:hypothetical protein
MRSEAPKHLPALSFILEALGNPSPATLAKHLDVTTRTVHRWLKADAAPRAVCLALFWDTAYGRSAVECRAVNDAITQAQLARCNLDLAQQRLRELEHLLAVGSFGSANQPLMSVNPGLAREDFASPITTPAPEAQKPQQPHASGRHGFKTASG